MKKLYVRVRPKSGQATFFRCGMKFSRKWDLVENIDAATIRRLKEEQMLEVSETEPADLEEDTPSPPGGLPAGRGADAPGGSTVATGSGTPAAAPEDTAARLEAVRAAIGQLDKEDGALWTAGGKPKTEAIAAITGWPVTAAERDAAMAEAGEQ